MTWSRNLAWKGLSVVVIQMVLGSQGVHAAQPESGWAGTPPACEDGIVLDDGTFEGFYGWDNLAPAGSYSMALADGDPSMVVDRVCVCLTRNGADPTLNASIDFFAFDYTRFTPQPTPVASFPVQALNVPAFPGFQFYSFPIEQALQLNGFPTLSVSVTWNPDQEQDFFLCADESAPEGLTPPARTSVDKVRRFASGGRDELRSIGEQDPGLRGGGGFNWMRLGTPTTFPDYYSLSIRAVLHTDLIFRGDFEEGSTGEWSATVGGAP